MKKIITIALVTFCFSILLSNDYKNIELSYFSLKDLYYDLKTSTLPSKLFDKRYKGKRIRWSAKVKSVSLKRNKKLLYVKVLQLKKVFKKPGYDMFGHPNSDIIYIDLYGLDKKTLSDFKIGRTIHFTGIIFSYDSFDSFNIDRVKIIDRPVRRYSERNIYHEKYLKKEIINYMKTLPYHSRLEFYRSLAKSIKRKL